MRGSGADRGDGAAELVCGEDPAEDQADVLAAEVLDREGHGRWHGRHPVEPVEDDEEEQADPRRVECDRQGDQREPA